MIYTQTERVNIVLDIVRKLKNYKIKSGNTINLYNEELCSFITEFKVITKKYIKEETEYKGSLYFEEIDKTYWDYMTTEQQREIFEQAKQMERNQHGNTWDSAIKAHDDRGHVFVRSTCDFDDYEIS